MVEDMGSESNHGRRLLPIVVDELATSDPNRVFASIPTSKSLEDGFRDINFAQLSKAINRCAWWIEENLGCSKTFETLNYVGPEDLRYIILLFAAIKTGYQMFFNSPWNSTEGHIALLETLHCNIALSPEVLPPITQTVVAKRQMRTLEIQTLQELLEDGAVSLYPYEKTFEQARYEPFVVLQTSGSTGFPKPVILTHGTVAHHDTFILTPPNGEKPIAISLYRHKRVFVGLRMFHSAALCFMAFAIYSDTKLVLPPPTPVTAEIANFAHVYGNLDASFVSPAVLVQIAKNPEYLKNIRKLPYLSYGGGPLPREIGNVLKLYSRLFVNFGATETGFFALQLTDREDWEYMSFSARMGVQLRPVVGELYELHFVRKPELEFSQGIFSTFPNLSEYSTKDLFSKHPTKENLWLFEGRSDDVIVCSTGQKINPMKMESLLNAHPSLVVALVCGQGRVQVSLLVEAKSPPRMRKMREIFLCRKFGQWLNWETKSSKSTEELRRI
ncbi:hypothetical protein EAF04_007682 [Stromatinia cepivora]|nr:hypothetical protein EAF04_007682 [Stromatinia cepivora]